MIIKIGYSFITKKPIQGEAKERRILETALYTTDQSITSFNWRYVVYEFLFSILLLQQIKLFYTTHDILINGNHVVS